MQQRKRIRIHLVEDNPDMLETMRMLLGLRGYEARCYLRALDLLDVVDTLAPDDVVISDYYLPDMNGVELLKRVRRSLPRLRALLLTGSRERGISTSAGALSNCEVLYKPVALEVLERGIQGGDGKGN